jgi:ADP-ribose pyrophosphatase YjhB (NUDIX family)
MGIHYDYKSKRGERAVLRQAKREARLAAKKAKRKNVVEEQNSTPIMHDILKPITLEDLTNPDNKK